MKDFDRYAKFRNGSSIDIVPFGEIGERDSDIHVTYERGTVRLDQLSSTYYGNPNYAWLILQANAKYGSLEYRIPDGADLRIPYPLEAALGDYQQSLEKNKKYYS